MSKYVVSHKKGFIALVALVCLTAMIASTWRAYSQTRQVPGLSQGTKPMDSMIANLKRSGVEFPAVELFQAQEVSASALTLSRAAAQDVLSKGVVLNPDKRMAQQIARGETPAMTLSLPEPSGKSGLVELELAKVDIFADGFSVATSSSGGRTVDYEESAHYRGVVKGSPGSVATLSVLGDEVVGMYSTPGQGNFVLGRLGGVNPDDSHILYSEADLKMQNPHTCETKDDLNTSIPQIDLEGPAPQAAGGCVRIYVEADHDLFLNKGSVTNTVNYITAFFNQSATIYSNDGVAISLSQVFVWDTPSPYTSSSSSGLLSQFQSLRNSFNGDLGHLVALRGGGGIAAGFNAFCNSNTDARQCFSGINPTFSNVPTYSWTVEVFTHEMGHLMGSRHTHACVWNGNNTAIDGCSTTEGGCARPGIPANGGTIMSYCHLTSAGINFSNGFGPQPGALIRNRITAAPCIVAGCGGGGGGAELIANGGFESGISPWVLSGAALRSTGAFPRSGVAYTIVVNANNTTGAEYQQIAIPTGAARNLTFWLNVTSSETTTTTQFDRIFVEVRSTTGALLSTLATFSNLNKGASGAYVQRGPFSLSAFAGQTVRIQFRATNDSSLPSSFRVDDVSVR
jgi:Metallo-peptidase family M12